MMVFYSPQQADLFMEYVFDEEQIKVTIEDTVDTFDFSVLNVGDRFIRSQTETDLIINPIISAERREDGELYIELANFIGIDATEEERFPEWVVAENKIEEVESVEEPDEEEEEDIIG